MFNKCIYLLSYVWLVLFLDVVYGYLLFFLLDTENR